MELHTGISQFKIGEITEINHHIMRVSRQNLRLISQSQTIEKQNFTVKIISSVKFHCMWQLKLTILH